MDLYEKWQNHVTNKNEQKSDKAIAGIPFKDQESGEDEFRDKKEEFIKCSNCQDRGYVVLEGKTKKCKSCDGYNILNEIKEVNDFSIERNLKSLNIPEFYLGKKFNAEEIKTNEAILKNLREDPMMELYIRKLTHLYNNISLGIKLENSFIIMAPQGYSKNYFVYCSMQEAVKYGYSVAPYLDTEEWLELKIKNEEKFKEYIRKDILFMKLLPAYVSVDDTQMVKYILDKRARLGLPTIVTSRFNSSFLHYIELHLENNIGLLKVDKYDYSKLKEITGIYPNDYSNLVKKFESETKKKAKLVKDIRDGVSKIHDKGILSNTEFSKDFDVIEGRIEIGRTQYEEGYYEKYKGYYEKNKK